LLAWLACMKSYLSSMTRLCTKLNSTFKRNLVSFAAKNWGSPSIQRGNPQFLAAEQVRIQPTILLIWWEHMMRCMPDQYLNCIVKSRQTKKYQYWCRLGDPIHSPYLNYATIFTWNGYENLPETWKIFVWYIIFDIKSVFGSWDLYSTTKIKSEGSNEYFFHNRPQKLTPPLTASHWATQLFHDDA